jgi:beta-galactosidase/beta-glucuronidase
MAMTYRSLLQQLQKMDDSQLDCNCSVYTPWESEFFELDDECGFMAIDDVLDAGHPILYVLE